MGWSPCVHFQIAVNVVAKINATLGLVAEKCPQQQRKGPYEPETWETAAYGAPTPVPPAALKMPSRLGVMRDVQYSPTEADPPISIALTL